LTVLVVDDAEMAVRTLEEMLAREGTHVSAASGLETARLRIHEATAGGRPFSAVILDAALPGAECTGIVNALRESADHRDATIVFTSLVFDPSDYARAKALSAAACLTKPILPAELWAAISNHPRSVPPTVVQQPRAVPLPSAVTPLTVLVAEDNPVNQRLTRELLTRQGHTVLLAENGREAVLVATTERVDLVLMDVQMPEMNGLEATHIIRAAEAGMGHHVPIVAITAHALSGDRERCLAAGMDGYVTKPISAAALRTAVAAFGPSRLPSGAALRRDDSAASQPAVEFETQI
jgi:CheY-like chemotaxis protein